MTSPIVKRFLISFDRHKWIGFASFTLVVGAAGVVGMQKPPEVYTASGVLSYNRPPVTFSTTSTQIQDQGQVIVTEELLTAEPIIKAAAARVKTDPKEVARGLSVKLPAKDAEPVILVRYTGDQPEKSAVTLESLMQAMVEQSRVVNSARLRAIIQSIEARMPQVTQDLRNAESRLERYVRTEGPAIVAAQDGSLLGAITGAEQQQRQLALQIAGVTTQMESIQRKLGLNPDQAYTSSALSADPIIANLRSQIYQTESQMEILSRDLRPEHPNMIQLRRQLDSYDQLLQARANEVLQGKGTSPLPTQIRQDSSLDPARQQLANTLVSLQTQRETLQEQLKAIQAEEVKLRQAYSQTPNKQMEQARLQQQVALKQELYSKMMTALVDAKSAEAETVSSLSIAQPPRVLAPEQQGSSLLLTLLLGGAIGTGVAAGLIFLLSRLDGTLYDAEEIRPLAVQRDVPILGELPVVAVSVPGQGVLPLLLETDTPYQEAYDRFRDKLRRASETPVKVVMLTSVIANEGKSITAYNLAIASAHAGKRTLLIEADLRSPSNAKLLKVAPDLSASLEPLRYYGNLNEAVRLVPDVENFYLIPSPGPVRNPVAILESSEFRRLIEDARGRFDLVVLDCPALSRCNDSLSLEGYTDGIVLTTRPGYTQGSLLEAAIEQLNDGELPLLGVVITCVDAVPVADDLEEEEEEAETETNIEDSSSTTPIAESAQTRTEVSSSVPPLRRR